MFGFMNGCWDSALGQCNRNRIIVGFGANSTFAECNSDPVPITKLLHMSGILLGQRTVQTVFTPWATFRVRQLSVPQADNPSPCWPESTRRE
jgi:hypothetical protein